MDYFITELITFSLMSCCECDVYPARVDIEARRA